MHILITGGGGFIGNRLARELARRKRLTFSGQERPITKIVLADVAFTPESRAGLDPLVTTVEGDVSSPELLRTLVTPEVGAVYHLAAMVSGQGERDFDGCLRINLDGTRHLLEACRALGTVPRLVFASSLAVFGGPDLPAIASDKTKPLPQTTYGMTKLMGELLINDYSRKGYIDGRAGRLPTIFIRPGKPNAAASSFASALFREPLAGRPYALPVPRNLVVALLGYRTLVQNLIAFLECDAKLLGVDRTVTFPSNRYRVDEMIEVLRVVAKNKGRTLAPITDEPDPQVIKIVGGWPIGTESARAHPIGLNIDPSLDRVIEDYLEDFG